MSLSILRHEEVFPAHLHNESITLVGAGAIGSRVWAALVELGLTNLSVYDYDNVEGHNLANQVYNDSDIGKLKTEALRDWTARKLSYVPQTMKFHAIKIEQKPEQPSDNPVYQPELGNTVILAVDTVAAREHIVEWCMDNDVFHVFDIRMASTHGDVYYFSPANPIATSRWINSLPDEGLAEVSSCGTSLTVGTTASIIANLAVWQLMHLRHNPEAMDDHVQIYLKPLMLTSPSTN